MSEWTDLLQILFWLAIAVSVAGTLFLPLAVIHIPADYFSRPPRESPPDTFWSRQRILVAVVRNCLAAVFFLAGAIMLFTPGQGLLMLWVSLWVASFPGKRRLERRLISTPSVLKLVNTIRVKAGAPPLEP